MSELFVPRSISTAMNPTTPPCAAPPGAAPPSATSAPATLNTAHASPVDHGLPESIVQIFREHVAEVHPEEIQESLLIRNGHYCGQKLVYAGWTVTWFVEEGQLKVFNPDGRLEQVCRLTPSQQPTTPLRRAA